jgi:hypothetical protein
MLQIRYDMNNQQFYNFNFNNQAPRSRNSQFRSFNSKLKPASEVEKKVSLDTRPTQTSDGFDVRVEEESYAKTTVTSIEDTYLDSSVRVKTPDMHKHVTSLQHCSRLIRLKRSHRPSRRVII